MKFPRPQHAGTATHPAASRASAASAAEAAAEAAAKPAPWRGDTCDQLAEGSKLVVDFWVGNVDLSNDIMIFCIKTYGTVI